LGLVKGVLPPGSIIDQTQIEPARTPLFYLIGSDWRILYR